MQNIPAIKILIVEDDQVTAKNLEKSLARYHYEVIDIIRTGEDAIIKSKEYKPNLILMDIMLDGEIDGITAAREIRESMHVPIVFLTGQTDEDYLEQAKISGAYGFIHKPINRKLLRSTIEIALSKHKMESDLRKYRDHLEELVQERTEELKKSNDMLQEKIDELQHKEEALKESEQELRARNTMMIRDLEEAKRVQQELLPKKLPKSDNLEIAYKYIPMEEVGGDYLFIRGIKFLNSNSVFIGDVAGHGVSAALFTFLVRALTDRLYKIHYDSPAEFITELNRELVGDMGSHFLTGIYGFFQPKDYGLSFTFAKGGHPYPVLYSKETNTVSLMKSKGISLGWFEESEYEEVSVDLKPGDRIFMYTDGLIEVVHKKNWILNFEGLIELIHKTNEKNMTISDTLDYIMDNIQSIRRDSTIKDDIVIIGFEVT